MHGNGGNLLQSRAATSPHDEGFPPKLTPVSYSSGPLPLFSFYFLSFVGFLVGCVFFCGFFRVFLVRRCAGESFCTLGIAGAKKNKIHSCPVSESIKDISALAI